MQNSRKITALIDKDHFAFLKKLVLLEEAEENEEIRRDLASLSPKERELRGQALLGLVLKEKHFSPAEHVLATFCRRDGKPFPLFSLETGDIVTVFPEQHEARAWQGDFPTGTVYEKTADTLTVAFSRPLPEEVEEGGHYQLHRSLNRATYKRMLEALDAVRQTQGTRLAIFRDILLGERKASFENADPEIDWLDQGLNRSQKEAVRRAFSAKDLSLVHGPPGTGKTTALVEIIRQAVKQKLSMFVTAPSNTACDNLLERLVEKGVNALRLGHPARISVVLREHTLDFKLALHPSAQGIRRLEAERERLSRRRERYRERRSPGLSSEREVASEIADLKREILHAKQEVFRRVMKEAEAIVGTPAGIWDKSVRDWSFDLLVFDEATQAIEPLAWIPVRQAKKIVMAGDHFQLPPTVRSKEAEEKGLGITLFERFYGLLPPEFRTLLERQYRMHETIMEFSSREFYGNKLVADESVKARTLADLAGVKDCIQAREPLVFIDTAGKGFEEKLEQGSESRYNPEEAHLVLSELQKMLSLGVSPQEIAVISPYSAQVRLLASQTPDPRVEIDSVDGFQGREKDLVIVSLVRSNREGEMGFLVDTRRMNVAMTRARRKLLVIGDSATLAAIPFYRDFMKYAEAVGGYRSVWEL